MSSSILSFFETRFPASDGSKKRWAQDRPRTIRIAGILAVLTPLLLVTSVACSDGGAETAESASLLTVSAASGAFAEEFVRIGAVVPEQSEDEPIVRLSGIDVRGDGAFMIGDASESQVKLFDRDGRMTARIGRRGEGPGEFQAPRYPRFGPDGRIYVADSQMSRIQVFDASGGYLHGILVDVPRIQGFEILDDGRFLILAPRELTGNVLVQTDSTGAVLAETLPIADVLPEGESPHRAWGSVRYFSLAMSGDTAFVSSSASTRLWQVDLSSGTTTTSILEFEGYIAPRISRDDPPANPRELFAWAKTVHLASALSAGAREVHLPFVQGILNYGDPMVLLSRSSGGEWHALTGAPPVVFAHGDSLLAIEDPGADYLTLGVYTRRR